MSHFAHDNFFRTIQELEEIVTSYSDRIKALTQALNPVDSCATIVSGCGTTDRTIIFYSESAYEIMPDLYRPACLSCGSPLEIESHGRRKFCAHCGCYLPEIVYNEHLLDATKMPIPNPLPTTKSH